jgi:hypothetical protein
MRIPTPASQAEADKGGNFTPWPAGDYDFEVENAEDETSKASGRDQMKLTLLVFNAKGEQRKVFDYLGADEKSQWKVRHFCGAIGLIPQYESGELEPYDCIAKQGRLALIVRPARGEYGASNSVRDYIQPDENATAKRPAPARPAATQAARKPVPASSIESDEIPF